MEELIIKKASGETAVFSLEKLRQSMRNAGANENQIESVINEIIPRLYQGISTKKIYKWAFGILKDESKDVAARYKLKNALMELGPSGFPFERFVGELFKKQAYHIKIGKFIQGSCISHEVDIVASSEKENLMIECKFHSEPGKLSDVKVPLYINSRFNDIKTNWIQQKELKDKELQGWVVTNTRFSPDAVKYGKCVNLHLLSWDYPLNNGLKNMIDEHSLYPLTCITSLTTDEKEKLLQQNFLLSEELIGQEEKMKKIGISEIRIVKILEEINLMSKKK